MLDTSGFDTGLGFVDAGFDLLGSNVGVSRNIPDPKVSGGGLWRPCWLKGTAPSIGRPKLRLEGP